MSRMLEALKQIEARSPQPRPVVKPVSPEELESFGLRQPAEPAQSAVLREQTQEPPAGTMAQQTAPEVVPAAEPDRDAGRVSTPLAEPHREAYWELADSILGQLSPVRPAVLLFTSAGDGEGKTCTLASLSAVLAEKLDDEVVAVDANFRSPSLASHFGIWADRGLVDVLAGGTAWHEAIRKTGRQGLSVLPGGRFPTADRSPPADLRLSPVLDALRNRYRLVLVDAASLLYPEVAPLSKWCEGTYLVVRLGRTLRGAARQAVRVIEQSNGRVLGCVLTDVPA